MYKSIKLFNDNSPVESLDNCPPYNNHSWNFPQDNNPLDISPK